MNVAEAVATRRSIRAFENRPVPRAMIEAVLEKAQMAPSSLNLQPWHAVVLSGAPLAALSAAMKGAAGQGGDYASSSLNAPAHLLARRDAIMAARFNALGIDRSDTAARAAFQRRNLEFFGAPVCLFTFIPRVLTPTNQGSAGLWLQSVMLLAVEAGLGTCPQESLGDYGALVKAACGVDDAEYRLWCGLAIGWPDMSAPVNNYPRARAGLAESAHFIGFE